MHIHPPSLHHMPVREQESYSQLRAAKSRVTAAARMVLKHSRRFSTGKGRPSPVEGCPSSSAKGREHLHVCQMSFGARTKEVLISRELLSAGWSEIMHSFRGTKKCHRRRSRTGRWRGRRAQSAHQVWQRSRSQCSRHHFSCHIDLRVTSPLLTAF